ncbi:hypothetical protein GLAREA_09068 [Glarea lozoyensis ATCC 20868]|uniref:Uncharacterized protein n=1 Tax=Glarea lozoyensis (strain ATCC 20868 / MF5171) TaxID=1116229 RepID=S3DGT2_GLAL2|nr:uncharacterized protein GLAREA_09068 [Glarea lozoyensis ATCC 20868]EPE36905.1 hypothetical protein GLAREA_09068 [Glarea lozoyensis ATCC 20868]
MIKGSHRLPKTIQTFSVSTISLLHKAYIPVIWALKTREPQTSTASEHTSTIDILKSLVLQAIAFNSTIHTDSVLCPRLRMYLTSASEDEWFTLLVSVLHGVPLIYIIIDIQLLHSSSSQSAPDFRWSATISRIFKELSERSSKTVVRVMMVSYGSSAFSQEVARGSGRDVLAVGNMKQMAQKMKSGAEAWRGELRGGLELGEISNGRLKR